METIKAGYICRVCGIDTTDVDVRQRCDGEGIENYTYHVNRICGSDHALRSPLCRTKALDLKLPVTQNGIGVAGPQLTAEDRADIDRQLKEPK